MMLHARLQFYYMSWKIAGQSHNYWRQYEISYTYFEIRLAKNQLNWADAHLIAYI